MTVSQTLVAGDTLSFTTPAPTGADGTVYRPADGWVLAYRLVLRNAATAIVLTATTEDDDTFAVAASATTTAAWTAGTYDCAAYVTLGTETYTVEPAFTAVTILPNPRTATSFDGRTAAQKAYDDAEAALQDAAARAANVGTSGSASSGLVEYTIGERRFKYGSPQEAVQALIVLRNHCALALKRERVQAARDAGYPNPTHVYQRMGRV